MITVWNYKLTAQDVVLTLYYSGGEYRIPVHLEARQAYNLDMLSLVRSRVPDPGGALIPDNITSGSAVLSGPKSDSDRISVAVAASVFNVRNATCGGQCTSCNGAVEVGFNPAAYAMAVGGSQNAQFQLTWNTGSVDTNPFPMSWSIQNSSIATVNSSGTITGQSPGQTEVTAVVLDYPVYPTGCSSEYSGPCPPYTNFQGQAPVNVAPTLTLSTPLWFFGPGIAPPTSFTLGSNKSVVTASGASGGTFNWSITGGIVSFSSTSQQSTATTTGNTITVYSIGASTSANDVTIQLAWTPSGEGQIDSTLNLSVDSPYKLVPQPQLNSYNGATGTSCQNPPPGTNGYDTKIWYLVQSYFGQNIAGVDVNENFTADDQYQYDGTNWTSPTNGQPVLLGSTGFADNICIINSNGLLVPAPYNPGSTLSSEQVLSRLHGWYIGSATSGQGILVQIDTMQMYIDHGADLDIESPAP